MADARGNRLFVVADWKFRFDTGRDFISSGTSRSGRLHRAIPSELP